jgi:hypothetical protein
MNATNSEESDMDLGIETEVISAASRVGNPLAAEYYAARRVINARPISYELRAMAVEALTMLYAQMIKAHETN